VLQISIYHLLFLVRLLNLLLVLVVRTQALLSVLVHLDVFLYGNVERGLAFIINNVGVCTES
jgi:hypothetical protein